MSARAFLRCALLKVYRWQRRFVRAQITRIPVMRRAPKRLWHRHRSLSKSPKACSRGIKRMKAIWLTDIHLNFLKQKQLDAFLKALSGELADCFFISGDIAEADSVVKYLKQMSAALKRPIYFVLGNHDYYGSSIVAVRARLADWTQKQSGLVWLNKVDYISLTQESALVGHDSWADGRLGDYEWSSVDLNDFRCIDELKLWDRAERLKAMQGLANEAAVHLKRVLPLSLKDHRHVIVLNH